MLTLSHFRFLFLFFSIFLCSLFAEPPPKRSPLAVHHSFSGPYSVPNWILFGNAYFRENYVRLTPDRQSRTGAIWNTAPLRTQSWEATVEFRIHGQGKTGADGFGLWYTSEAQMGPFYGANPAFVGLGIVVDTYDNGGSGVHPRLMVLVSDGTQEFNENHDHESHEGMEKGGCHFPCRHQNKDTRSFIRVSYTREKKVIVETSTTDIFSFTECAVVENVDLPTGYYLGLTAATGQLADNHDIFSLTVKNLNIHTTETYTTEQQTLASLTNRFERKIEDIQNSIPSSLSLSPSFPTPTNDPRVANNLAQIGTTLSAFQADVRKEISSFHQRLDSLSIQLNSLKNAKEQLDSKIKTWRQQAEQDTQATDTTSEETEEGTSWLTYSVIGLLVLILGVLVHFQHQTTKDLKGW